MSCHPVAKPQTQQTDIFCFKIAGGIGCWNDNTQCFSMSFWYGQIQSESLHQLMLFRDEKQRQGRAKEEMIERQMSLFLFFSHNQQKREKANEHSSKFVLFCLKFILYLLPWASPKLWIVHTKRSICFFGNINKAKHFWIFLNIFTQSFSFRIKTSIFYFFFFYVTNSYQNNVLLF